MKTDQNRIELRLNTAEYDECVLCANDGARILPGTLLVFTDGNVSGSRDPVRPNRGYASFDYEPDLKAKVYTAGPDVVDGHSIDSSTGERSDSGWGPYTRYRFEIEESEDEEDILKAYAYMFSEDETPSLTLLKEKMAVPGSIDRFPCAVVLENALHGKSLNHESPNGELVLCRYLTETNEVLLRAVPGLYLYGDIVYAVQTEKNGIWVASESTLGSGIASGILGNSAALGMKVGICQEDYRVTADMCSIMDDTEPEDATGYDGPGQVVYGVNNDPLYTRYFSGALVNLIKVRTTAFYATTTPLPTIDGVSVSPVEGLLYDGNAKTDLRSLFNISGTNPSTDIISPTVQGAGEVKNAGEYTIVVQIQREGYQTLTKKVVITVGKKMLRVYDNTDWERVADGTTTGLSANVTGDTVGILTGDNVVVTGRTDAFPSPEPGDYELTVTYSLSGSSAGNYALQKTTENVTATIKPAAGPNPTGEDEELEGVSIGYSSLGDTITYDGVERPISSFFDITGTEAGDDINYYVDGTLFGGDIPTVKVPGIYSVTITVDREGYAQFSETLPVTINKAHVTVTGSTAQSKAYDKSTYATLNLGTVTGLVAEDDATLGYAASFASSLPGVQDVAVTYSLGGADIGHYILDTVNETLSAEITTKPFSITGTEIKEKVYDGTSAAEVVVGSVTGLIEGDDVTITGSAIFHTVTVGNYNITVHYTLTGADADKYYAAPQTRPTRIKPKQLTISGTTVADKTYDGTTDTTITPGTLSGLVNEDTVNLSATGSFPSADIGTYDVEVSYSISGGAYRNYYAPVNDTIAAEITAATITGISVSSSDITEGDALVIDVSGTEAGDTVVYIYDGVEYSDVSSLPISGVGEYAVDVKVSRTNYADWTGSTTFEISAATVVVETFHYAPTTNGGSTRTTTGINLLFMPDGLSGVVPDSIPYSAIEVGGDAVLNTEDENCVIRNSNAFIPIRMVPKADGAYMVTIRINGENSDTQTKTIPANFMSGYWGCYPCQLNGGATEPSADQIVDMVGINVLTGAKVSSVSCTFELSRADWENGVEAFGVTGDDADFDESGCGYEFFITCWENTSVGQIMNQTNIPQNAAFRPFVITINGVEYSGVISKNCELPSGTSPYTFSLS